MAMQSQAGSSIAAPAQRQEGRGAGTASLAWTSVGRTLWSHKLFLASLVISVVLLTSLHVSQVPPVYEAETLVLLDGGEGNSDMPGSLAPSPPEQDPASEARVFRSLAMAERLVDTLSLHLLPEFNTTLRPEQSGLRDWFDPARLVPNSLFNRLPAALREVLSARAAVSDQQQAATLRAEVAERTLAHITAEPADRASVLRVRFVSNDPKLAALGANTLVDLYLADRLAATREVSARARRFLRDEVARLRARIADATLRGLMAEVEPSSVADGPEALAEAVQADRDLLEARTARLHEVDALVQAQTPGASVISAAAIPDEPLNPRRNLTFGAALLGAFVVGSLAALGLERLDNTISSAGQLGKLRLADLGALPTVAVAPDRRRTPDRHVLDHPDAPFALAVAGVRKNLVRANAAARRTSVLLTSALEGVGTTTTALCLARSHARAGGHPLLIECDARRPRLHDLIGASSRPGLTDVLLGDRTLEQVVHLDERSGAVLVTAGHELPDAKALLASEAMRRLLREAATDHDLVLLDGPPVLDGAEACVLARAADGTVLLAQWGSTRREDVAAAAQLLIEAGADMAGLVLTRARSGAAIEG